MIIIAKTTVYCLSVQFLITVHQKLKRQNSGLPQMESIFRFTNIPVVEDSLKTANKVYQRVKVCGMEEAKLISSLVD